MARGTALCSARCRLHGDCSCTTMLQEVSIAVGDTVHQMGGSSGVCACLECRMVEAALQRGGEEELLQLMARFRQCFVDALQPQHLSRSWQINHR